jgi:alpha-mannosidase
LQNLLLAPSEIAKPYFGCGDRQRMRKESPRVRRHGGGLSALTASNQGLVALLLLCCLAKAGAAEAPRANRSAPQDPERTKGTLWIIPHTHWEGAVFKTREEYLEIGLPNILTALRLLKDFPGYCFVLDQAAYVKPFLERYPEQEAAFRKFLSEGRLELVGGNDVMLDVNIPSGESWVRQVLFGKGYYRDRLGVDVTVGWALDTFGHHAQMPQLLKLAGYKSYWFQRGVKNTDAHSEFLWQGIDGTRIPAFWLPLGYGLFYPAAKNIFEFDSYARGIWLDLGHYSSASNRVAVAGADVIEPEQTLPVMEQEFNRRADASFSLRFSVPSKFEAVAAKESDRPVVSGELNPVFQGVYSSRIELKQWMRDLERLLLNVEKWSAIASWLGTPADSINLTRAWEPVLFNQAHDLTSGTMVDKVYEDTLRGYQFSKSLGDEILNAELNAITSRVDTRSSKPDGIPLVVCNSLGWSRNDLGEAAIGFSAPGIFSLEVLDPTGQAVPIQFTGTQRYDDGSLKFAKVSFMAHDVPGFGYSVYQAFPRLDASEGTTGHDSRLTGRSSSTMHEDSGSIENEFYRATFDLWTGAMTSLLVKPGNWEALGRQPANVVAREQDGGDFWELYGTLNGGRLTAMTRRSTVPARGEARFSNEFVGGSGETMTGPVFSEFHITHPFGDGRFATTVRVYSGIRRIDIKTEILNNDKFVRYRALFPTSIAKGRRFDEIPFGAVERPAAQEFPAQNWIDYGDGMRGVALLNHGLPGNNVADATLMLSLMRSARITAYPFFGGYEPGVSSDLGLELGNQMTFDYALFPHDGDWKEAGVYRSGLEFNNPLIVRKVAQHPGVLPNRWGLFEVSQSNVVTSALKPGADGGVVLRVYEASGRAAKDVRIKFRPHILSAKEANLLEESTRSADIRDGALAFDLGAYEIKTFKLALEPLPGQSGER